MRRYGAVACLLLLALGPRAQAHTDRGRREDRRLAADHVTQGWLVTYDNPDPDRSWERISGSLVIARHGKVIRWIDAVSVIRQWAFWQGGRKVAVEAGGLHGPTACFLVSIRTGRTVAKVAGDCDIEDDAAPAWVKALARSEDAVARTPPSAPMR